jgi:two-component system sensor histidine kinase CpxA
MRSLFTRIFLSFWIVLGVIIAGCVAATTMVAWHRIAVLGEINFDALNRDAEVALRSGSEAGLTSWLKKVGDTYPGVDIYVLTVSGNDLLHREVPPRLRQWLVRGNGQKLIAASSGQSPLAPGLQYSASHLLDSSRISGLNGKDYTLAVAWYGSSPVDVLGSYDILPLLLVLALIVSAIVSWWIAHYISAPIHELQLSARILARGNLDAKVEDRFSKRRDEIGILARDFNHMAAQLRSQISAKEVLLRDVSHELRSPLTRIQIALGLAGLEKADIGVQHQRIERDVERMNTLIGEIMQLTRLTSAPQSFPPEQIDLSRLIDEIADDVALEAKPFGKHLALARPSNVGVYGNPEMLRRAIENVLRNAIRFSPNDAEIALSVVREPAGTTICVRDKGPGVPEADIQRIFDPFYRVSVARDRDSGGTGLGLAITARVMSLHGGHASACNISQGGLAVMLFLPAFDSPKGRLPGETIESGGSSEQENENRSYSVPEVQV